MIETNPLEYSDLDTNEIWINMGPHHPSTHGVFRVILKLDGETVVDSELVLGYLHRGLEKLAEQYTYVQYVPITDRMDYINGPSNELAYVMAVEKLASIKPPERAEYIRVILAELARYQNHLMAIGFLLNDLGAYFTPVMYGFRERERILDLWEMVSGSRMMPNYLRFGGVLRDLPDGWLPALNQTLDLLEPFVDEFERLLSDNEILKARTIGVGVLPADLAVNYSCSGPMLRGSGVAYDIRRAEPYSIYDRFDFDVITRPGGDAYDRYIVRLREMRESLKIIRQAVKQLPEGEVYAKPRGIFRPPAGEAYARIESPKGELGFYVVSDGSPKPYRVKVRAPSYINLNPFSALIKGAKVADVVVVLGSIDIILGEVDR